MDSLQCPLIPREGSVQYCRGEVRCSRTVFSVPKPKQRRQCTCTIEARSGLTSSPPRAVDTTSLTRPPPQRHPAILARPQCTGRQPRFVRMTDHPHCVAITQLFKKKRRNGAQRSPQTNPNWWTKPNARACKPFFCSCSAGLHFDRRTIFSCCSVCVVQGPRVWWMLCSLIHSLPSPPFVFAF